jgi:hypothetical protein
LQRVQVSAKMGLGIDLVTAALKEAVRDCLYRRPPPPIGAGRVKVRDRLRQLLRMKGARKNAQGMITEPGNMVIYVAGYPAIMGLQPLYFRDSELARRARIPAESAQTKKLEDTLANANG